MTTEIAIFGGGCFWCTEAIFKELRGVISVTPGYAGGSTRRPTYDEVSGSTTGHAEVIRVEFNSEIIPYRDLLDIFMHTHDPTTLNRQGDDVGTQYRSVIIVTSARQKEEVEQYLKDLQSSDEFKQKKIVTELLPLSEFTEAEEYHKDYYALNKDKPYCQIVISPKLTKLRGKYADKLKEN